MTASIASCFLGRGELWCCSCPLSQPSCSRVAEPSPPEEPEGDIGGFPRDFGGGGGLSPFSLPGGGVAFIACPQNAPRNLLSRRCLLSTLRGINWKKRCFL